MKHKLQKKKFHRCFIVAKKKFIGENLKKIGSSENFNSTVDRNLNVFFRDIFFFCLAAQKITKSNKKN